MTQLKTTVTLSFWAEYPDDEAMADVQADNVADDLTAAASTLPYVADGSVSVDGFETGDA